jgi:hypothetical protein
MGDALKYKNISFSEMLPWLMVMCAAILLPVWPMIGTMALRNALLFLGGIIGIWYLFAERICLFQKPAIPLLFVALLFSWTIFHFFFIGRNAPLELTQLKGIGLRTLLGSLLATGCGLFARKHKSARKLIWAGILFYVVVFYLNYVWVSVARHNWSIPYPPMMGIYNGKISIDFYGIVALAMGCALTAYHLMQTKILWRNILEAMFYIGLVFLSFVFAGTKTGVVVGLFMILLLLSIYYFKTHRSFVTNAIAFIFIASIGAMTIFHGRHNTEWNNFFPTVSAGMQLDKYRNWIAYPDKYGLPVLPSGALASESAYLRTAWAVKGTQFLAANPLGYGLLESSFMYLMNETTVGRDFKYQSTLSGWLDFALGLGIPGLLLTWAAMGSTVYYSYNGNSLWAQSTRWILQGTFIVWIFAQISCNHFIETLFFLICLLTAGNIPLIKKPAPN